MNKMKLNISMIQQLAIQDDWEKIYNLVSKKSFEELVWILGLDYFELLMLNLEKLYPLTKELKIHKLKLLKHQGNFSELLKMYRSMADDPLAELIYLEYLNIVGESLNEDTYKNLIIKAGKKTYVHATMLNPILAEYIWLHEGVESALKFVKSKVKIYQKDKIYIGKLKFLEGEFLRHQGKYKKALDKFNESLKLLKDTFEQRYIALNYKSISVCYRNIDDWTNSLKNVTECLSIAKKFGDKSLLARCLISIGSFHEIKGDTEKALEYHWEAFKLGEEMNSVRDNFYGGLNIGVCLLQLNKKEEALEIFTKTLPDAKRLGREYYIECWIGFLKIMIDNDFMEGIKLLELSRLKAIEGNEPKRADIIDSLIGSALFLKSGNKSQGEELLLRLQKKTSSSVIKQGIKELLAGKEFHKTRLCS